MPKDGFSIKRTCLPVRRRLAISRKIRIKAKTHIANKIMAIAAIVHRETETPLWGKQNYFGLC